MDLPLVQEEETLRAPLYGWVGLHLLSIFALLAQRSTYPSVMGRYSSKVALMIVFLGVTLPLVWKLPAWLPARAARFRRRRAVWWWGMWALSGVGLAAIWSQSLGPTASHVVLGLYFSLVWGTIAFWALLRVPPLPMRTAYVLPPFLGLGLGALLLWIATFFPALKWTDEGYMVNAAWTFARTGAPLATMYQPVDLYAISFSYWGLGSWLRLLGFSLSAARAYIFSVGIVSFVVVFLAARKVYASQIAAWAGVITAALSLSVINYMHQDIEVALLLALAFYIYATTPSGGQVWKHALVGFLVGFSVDGHPVAYRFSIAFGLAYLWEWGRLLRTQERFVWHRPLGWLVLGGVLGVAFYIGWYTLHNPTFRSHASQSSLVFNGANSASVLSDEIRQALSDTPILLLLSALGALAAWRRNTPFDRLLTFAFIVSPIVLALFYPRMRQYYLMHTLTLQALLVAVLFQQIADALPCPKQRATVLSGLLVLLVIANGALLANRIRHKDAQSYDEALTIAAEIRDLIPPETTIVAPDPFYFGLWQYDFREATTPNKIALREHIPVMRAWETLTPDAVVVVHGYPIPELSESALEYVQTHAFRRAQTWTTQRLGTVSLYLKETR